MARTAKGKIDPLYHRLAEKNDPAWNGWFEQHDPVGLVFVIKGPADTTPDKRALEHKKIFARLETLYKECRDHRMGTRAMQLKRKLHTKEGERSFMKPLSLEEIAEILEKEFSWPTSAAKAGRLLNAMEGALGSWPSSDTHSITVPRKSD